MGYGQKVIKALMKVQGEIRNPENTSVNPYFRSKYAALPDILNMVRPLLNKNGLVLVQDTGSDEKGIFVITLLVHESGESFKTNRLYLSPVVSKDHNIIPVGNAPQQSGSAITYARRYQLTALLGISGEDDNDGNTSPPKKVTKPKVRTFKQKPKAEFETPKLPEKETPYTEEDEDPESIVKQWITEIISVIEQEGKVKPNPQTITMRAKQIASRGEQIDGHSLSKEMLHKVLKEVENWGKNDEK